MSASDDRLGSIETIRGGAAVAVAWYHLTDTYAGAARATGALGWLGVDCFFVISGFVIPLSLYRADYTLDRFPSFMARRLIRLEPPYLISIVLVVALQIASEHAPGFTGQPVAYAPAQIAAHLFYLVPLTTFAWINPVYWSLAYEFAFYIVAGVSFPLLWRQSIFLSAALACAVAIALHAFDPEASVRVPLFLMGFAAMRAYAGRDSVAICALGLTIALVVMVAFGGALSAFAGTLTALLILVSGRARDWPMPWLGRISYALYLTHVPIGGRVVNLGRRVVHGAVGELCLSIVALIACLLFAALFHRLVEAPFAELSRRWRRPTPTAAGRQNDLSKAP